MSEKSGEKERESEIIHRAPPETLNDVNETEHANFNDYY